MDSLDRIIFTNKNYFFNRMFLLIIIDIIEEKKYNMANQAGKRYICKKCDAEIIVTRGGNGTLQCCGQQMEEKK